ncbi:hypothetical protein [Sinorhizobium medicae]|uniref:hypothetical protein n=1 Tax=Sinorhizobium medicae TaxID=110321 RepID=UPI0013E3105C|nr:hypothetical protein [Sinorhizobium medicae]
MTTSVATSVAFLFAISPCSANVASQSTVMSSSIVGGQLKRRESAGKESSPRTQKSKPQLAFSVWNQIPVRLTELGLEWELFARFRVEQRINKRGIPDAKGNWFQQVCK